MNVSFPDFSAGTHNCAGADLEVFFSEQGGSPTYFDEARGICEGCPLLDECFSYALAYDVQGFWGGTTENERRKMRKLLGLRQISIEASIASLFPTPVLAAAGRIASVGDKHAETWAALPAEDACAARDLVLDEAQQIRDASAERARKRGLLSKTNKRVLTDDQVREIRRSTESCRVLGARYGVSDTAISNVRRRRRYASVPDEEAAA